MHFSWRRKLDSWYKLLLEQITRYSLDMGCDGIEGIARFGFGNTYRLMALKSQRLFSEGHEKWVAKAAAVGV